MARIEAAVDFEVALTWRCLAHARLPRGGGAGAVGVDRIIPFLVMGFMLKNQLTRV